MTLHSTFTTPLSQAPRLRFVDDMPAEDSSADVSDAWREETEEDANVIAYFKHTPDDHGGTYADLIGLRVQSDISLDLFTRDGAIAFMGWDAVIRIEDVQAQAIVDGVAT